MSAIRPLLRTAKVSVPKRTLATPVNSSLFTPVLPAKLPAALHLKSGQSFEGNSFGSQNSKFGETVFSTSITSCKS
jgi:carbamoyl-phosphate synthase small subunit